MKRRVLITEIALFASILLGTVYSAFRIYSPQDLPLQVSQPHEATSTNTSVALNSVGAIRSPSSIEKDIIQNGYEPFKVDCTISNFFETKSTRIRLVGEICKNEFLKNTQIKAGARNQSMKYDATIFQVSTNNSYSTDFIPLGIGNNLIEIDFKDNANQHQKINVQVVRSK